MKLLKKIRSIYLIDVFLNLKGNPRACIWLEPLWGIPYNLYVQTGNLEIVKDNIDNICTYVDHLAAACISVVHILDPEVLAIGGGVCHAGEFLFEPLRKGIDNKYFFSEHGKIVPAVMGNDAGIIGAAMLAQNSK